MNKKLKVTFKIGKIAAIKIIRLFKDIGLYDAKTLMEKGYDNEHFTCVMHQENFFWLLMENTTREYLPLVVTEIVDYDPVVDLSTM